MSLPFTHYKSTIDIRDMNTVIEAMKRFKLSNP